MNSDLDDIDDDICDMLDDADNCWVCPDDDSDYVDHEKQLKEMTEYIKEEHPSIFADMILKGIIT